MIGIKNEWKNMINFFSNANLIGVVIGLVIGSAFSQMINSLINNIIYPCLDSFVDRNVINKFIVLKKGPHYPYKNLKEAQDDNAGVIAWGLFSQSVLNLLIQGVCVYYVIKIISNITRFQKKIIK